MGSGWAQAVSDEPSESDWRIEDYQRALQSAREGISYLTAENVRLTARLFDVLCTSDATRVHESDVDNRTEAALEREQRSGDAKPSDLEIACHDWLVRHSVERQDGDFLVPASLAAGRLLAAFVKRVRVSEAGQHDPERCDARIEDYKRVPQSRTEALSCADKLRDDAEHACNRSSSSSPPPSGSSSEASSSGESRAAEAKLNDFMLVTGGVWAGSVGRLIWIETDKVTLEFRTSPHELKQVVIPSSWTTTLGRESAKTPGPQSPLSSVDGASANPLADREPGESAVRSGPNARSAPASLASLELARRWAETPLEYTTRAKHSIHDEPWIASLALLLDQVAKREST